MAESNASEINRTTAVEDRRDAYVDFFNAGWARDLLVTTKDSAICDAAIDLARNWQAASNARTWPWVVSGIADANLREGLDRIAPFTTQKIRAIRDKLINKLVMAGTTVRPALVKSLEKALADLDAEATEAMRVARQKTLETLPESWASLIANQRFHDMVWSSERTCYCAVYFNYECFLKECLRIVTGDDRLQVGKGFGGIFAGAFDSGLAGRCWGDIEINIAREARTAIVHNGGMLTPKLEKMPHRFHLEGRELQIAASLTTELYERLASRVTELVGAAMKMPEFARPSE